MRRIKMRTSPTGWPPTWRSRAGALDRARQHPARREMGRGDRPRAGRQWRLRRCADAGRDCVALGQDRDERRRRAGKSRRDAVHPAGCGGVQRAHPVEWLPASVVPRPLRRWIAGAAEAIGRETGSSDKVSERRKRQSRLLRSSACRQWCVQRRGAGRSTSIGSPSPPATS